MPYTTYEYYAKDFYGDIIPQESFSKYELKARFELDRYTFGRIKGLSITSSIEQCMCELMEYLFTNDRRTQCHIQGRENSISYKQRAASDCIKASGRNRAYV